jgi:hypothetical protein
VKPLAEWYQKHPGVENRVGDLALLEPCRAAAKGAKMIYNLAADMGGKGFIETHKAECLEAPERERTPVVTDSG